MKEEEVDLGVCELHGTPRCQWCGGCTHCVGWGVSCCRGFKFKPRTQKARGVIVLGAKASPFFHYTAELRRILRSVEEVDEVISYEPFHFFARPCPPRPRHGFVESRIVTSKDQLTAVISETLAAEPDGEVMLMTPIEAKFNAIWTPNLLVIGKGNDGATAGKGTISIPLVVGDGGISGPMLKAARIPDSEWPYVEIVTDAYHTSKLTQLRAGPKGEIVENFIPSPVTVSEVITVAGQDLIEWEKLLGEKAGQEGLVIYHPGGALTDHYSVHARTLNIPLFRTIEPVVGATYAQTAAPTAPDPFAVLKGAVLAEKLDLNVADRGELVALILTALHNSAAMAGENGKWLGVASVLMMRLGAMALKAEARYFGKQNSGGPKISRETVYTRAANYPLSRHRSTLNYLLNLFRYGQWSGSVGGMNWAACAAALIPLYNALRDLAREQTSEKVSALTLALNRAVNQAHNGGWWLNKFTGGDQKLLDYAAKGDLRATIRSIPAFWEFEVMFAKGDDLPAIQKRIHHYSQLPITTLEPPPVEEIRLLNSGIEGGFVIQPKIDALTRNKRGAVRQITIPADQIAKALDGILGQLYVVRESDRLRIEIRPDGKDPLTLYREPAVEEAATAVKQYLNHS